MTTPADNIRVYDETIKRLEPEIAMIDDGAYNASAAISLKRIADLLETRLIPPFRTPPTIQFWYVNHRNVRALRTVTLDRLEYLVNPGYSYKPGFFLTGRDNMKDAPRSFALSSIVNSDGSPIEGAKHNVTILKF